MIMISYFLRSSTVAVSFPDCMNETWDLLLRNRPFSASLDKARLALPLLQAFLGVGKGRHRLSEKDKKKKRWRKTEDQFTMT